eukprot:TRINITY_DN28284_c0_g1_i1.p1 TRINITY_DN28284_c0_g1~~TRINITY_DN28284_c0_g1_i1.p1  ORF type:complete len:1116 (+),score=322.68 TRINITY_DN28284_c0_g1_i1:391-3348(+)
MRATASMREARQSAADAAMRLRGLPRHPAIIRLVDAAVAPAEVLVVTEHVSTLRARLYTRGLSFAEIATGVAAVAEGLEWLHSRCGLAYNNVCLDGIHVASPQPGGAGVRWVLGDFAYCCSADAWDECRTNMAFQSVVAPEDCISQTGAPVCARDVYALGCLVDQLIAALSAGHAAPGCTAEDCSLAARAAELREELMPKIVELAKTGELNLCHVNVADLHATTSGGSSVQTPHTVSREPSRPRPAEAAPQPPPPRAAAAVPPPPPPPAPAECASEATGATVGTLADPGATFGAVPPLPDPAAPPRAASPAAAAGGKRKGGIGMLDDDSDEDDFGGDDDGGVVRGYQEHSMPAPPPAPHDGRECSAGNAQVHIHDLGDEEGEEYEEGYDEEYEEGEYEEGEYEEGEEGDECGDTDQFTTDGHYRVGSQDHIQRHAEPDREAAYGTPSESGFQVSSFAVAAASHRVVDSGLGALLNEVAGEITWLDDDLLPDVLGFVTKSPGVRPLNAGEELCIWALSAQHRSPSQRPPLSALSAKGRLAASIPLVRAVRFLRADPFRARDDVRQEGYAAVETCLGGGAAYCDCIDWLVPHLLRAEPFVDPAADRLYHLLLRSDGGGHLSPAPSPRSPGAAGATGASLRPGALVAVSGLRKAPELNGQQGRVVGFDEAAGRWGVRLETGESRAFRPENLEVLEAAADPGGTPSPSAPAEPLQQRGALRPADHARLLAPFLQAILQDREDGALRAALLRRLPLCATSFSAPTLLQEVIPQVALCVGDSDDVLCAAACKASGACAAALFGALCRAGGEASPKALQKQEAAAAKQVHEQLCVPICRLAASPQEPPLIRVAAAAGLLSLWAAERCPSRGTCLHGVQTALHDTSPQVRAGVLEELSRALELSAFTAREIVGLVVPLVTPLTLSKREAVRAAALQVLARVASTLRSVPPDQRAGAYPPRDLPAPATAAQPLKEPKRGAEPFVRKRHFHSIAA